jgi:hypothetical protein
MAKDCFRSYRDWEQAFVFFLCEQLRSPDVAAWQAVATDDTARRNAAFSSLMLTDLARRLNPDAVEVLEEVFGALTGTAPTQQDYREWYRGAWASRARVLEAVRLAFQQGLSSERHSLVA